MRPIVQSVKHYNHHTVLTITSAARLTLDIVKGQLLQDVNASNDVPAGAVVKAVYIELWVTSDDATQSQFIIALEKKSGSPTAMTAAQAQDLDDYPNKKNVLYVTQGLVTPQTGTPTPALRGWFKIPKGKQRFGMDDKLSLTILAIANGLRICGFNTYKHYQ